MIKALIIDDEQHCSETLSLLLKKHCENIEVVATAQNPADGYSLIQEYAPDLLFLDVEMPEINGFQFLKGLKKSDLQVIFVTAYSQYALQAIKFSALDYLLKPVDPIELKTAIGKIQSKTSHRQNIDTLLSNISQNTKKLIVNSTNEIEILDVKEILWCQAASNYTTIYLINNKKVVSTKSLKEFDDILSDNGFCRIHHSHLINLLAVKRYIKGDGGKVILSDNTVLEVSSRKKADFMSQLLLLR